MVNILVVEDEYMGMGILSNLLTEALLILV